MLDPIQKSIRNIAWGRLRFFKKILKNSNYSKNAIKKQICEYAQMFKKSNLDITGQKMAVTKLDKLRSLYNINTDI